MSNLILGYIHEKEGQAAVQAMRPVLSSYRFSDLTRNFSKNYKGQILVTDQPLSEEEQAVCDDLNVERVMIVKSVEEVEKFWTDLAYEYEAKKYTSHTDEVVKSLSFPISTDELLWLVRDKVYGQPRGYRASTRSPWM